MKKFILVFCLLAFFTSCTTKNNIPFPNLGSNQVVGKEKKELYSKLIENNKDFSNVRVLSDVLLVEKGEGFKFRYLFIYDKSKKLNDKIFNNNFLRIEAFPPETFLSLHILAQNEKEAVFLDRQQKIAIKTNDIKNIFKEIWKEDIDYKNLMEIFAGNNNLTNDDVNNYDFYIITANNNDLLQVVSKNKNEYYEFNLKDLSLLTYDAWNNNGKDLIMRVKKANNFLYVIIPQNELLMNFMITKKEFDVNVKQDVFNIKIPKNYKIYKK